MNNFPRNVNVTQRMQVIDISDVKITGVLSEESKEDNGLDLMLYEWRLTDGDDVASLSEWLDAFEGRNVVITIKLANGRDDGVNLQKKPMVQA